MLDKSVFYWREKVLILTMWKETNLQEFFSYKTFKNQSQKDGWSFLQWLEVQWAIKHLCNFPACEVNCTCLPHCHQVLLKYHHKMSSGYYFLSALEKFKRFTIWWQILNEVTFSKSSEIWKYFCLIEVKVCLIYPFSSVSCNLCFDMKKWYTRPKGLGKFLLSSTGFL